MTNNGDRRSAHTGTLRRAGYSAALGLLLFSAGYGVYESGVMGYLYSAISGKTVTIPSAAPYSRADMEAARKAYAKDAKASPPGMPVGADGYYLPPAEDDIPKGPYGDAIRRGMKIFTDTGAMVKDHVGNSLACANCHLDSGRRENAAPMWAAYASYPAFRSKTGTISTLEDRIMGCFTYSMNAQASSSGKPPPAGSDVYRDLMTYMAWMADGLPAGNKPRGALYPKVPKPKDDYDVGRGLAVYQQNCALCHGPDGQGTREENGKMRFPPLWGPESYNWGAGMARIDTAAGFIWANMPLGKPYSLTEQEAWDVAAFINSHERPKDTRQTGTVAEALEKYHEGEQSYYGKVVGGKLLGVGTDAKSGP